MFRKAQSSFIDAQHKSKSWCGSAAFQKKLQFIICIIERVTWCQLPSIRDLNGTKAGNCTEGKSVQTLPMLATTCPKNYFRVLTVY